jgi:rubredoxin
MTKKLVGNAETPETSDVKSDVETPETSDVKSDVETPETSDVKSDMETPETSDVKSDVETLETSDVKIANHPETNIVIKTDTVIVFQAKHVLPEHNYDLLSAWIRKENEASGLNIVLAPYSVDVKVGEVNGENNK